MSVNIKQHYSLQTAAPRRLWMVITCSFMGSCGGKPDGALLEVPFSVWWCGIFPVNTCKWLVNIGSHGQSAGCIDSICSSQNQHKRQCPSLLLFLIPYFTPITECVSNTHAHTQTKVYTQTYAHIQLPLPLHTHKENKFTQPHTELYLNI